MSAAQAAPNYEQAGELKIGQVGIANLRVRVLDVDALAREMRERVQRAPKLFGRAAVIVDFGALSQAPDAATAQALLAGLRDAGVLPVALAYGGKDIERLSEQLGLPLLAKFRESYERGDLFSEPRAADAKPVERVAEKPAPTERKAERSARAKAAEAPQAAASTLGMIHRTPVRSGMQVYAEGRDLTVLSTVSQAAEIISDGSIHVYGSLRGRALAGAQGNAEARIFCRDFRAELVAIAGTYKVLDDIPRKLLGKSVMVWLEKGELKIESQD